uniref:Uncharacterized protein n=1 Tax=Kalanchoe fedtschenkoi TaxID=63787 RepID=A0A7N0U5F9_KALFE
MFDIQIDLIKRLLYFMMKLLRETNYSTEKAAVLMRAQLQTKILRNFYLHHCILENS